MSQIAPIPVREPVEVEDRRPIPDRDRAEMYAEQDGRCVRCDVIFLLSELEGDHVIPRALGGKHVRSNWQLLCQVCHAVKTRQDRKDIAKANRLRRKDAGDWPEPVRKLQGRGFSPGRNRQETAR